MDIKKIKELLQLMERSKLKRLTIKEKNGFELTMEKEGELPVQMPASKPSFHPSASDNMLHPPEPALDTRPSKEAGDAAYITSPIVGTFYCAANPTDSPFIKVGDKVSEDTVVCIVEAMKVMNEVKAGKAGIVKEICVENMTPVEYGSNLFRIE